MKKKKKNKFKNNIKRILNSTKTLIVVLIIIIMILIWFCNHLMNSSQTYMFSGKSDYVTILNGVVSLSYDVNLIGYYVLKDNTLSPLVIKSGEDDIGLSLKGLINEMSAYNIAEPYHNKRFFTKENKKSLEEGLYFIIEAKTTDDEEILDKTELSLSKVSK